MTVSFTTSVYDLSPLPITGTSVIGPPSSATSTSGTIISDDSSSLSTQAKLFNQLDKLSESNPTEFKKLTVEIATELKRAAKSASDQGQVHSMDSMASNFEKASQSSKVFDLLPNQLPRQLQNPSFSGADSATLPQSGQKRYSSSSTDQSSNSLNNVFLEALSKSKRTLV